MNQSLCLSPNLLSLCVYHKPQLMSVASIGLSCPVVGLGCLRVRALAGNLESLCHQCPVCHQMCVSCQGEAGGEKQARLRNLDLF